MLEQAKKDLDRFYPVVDGKPAVAYLWARTVKCRNCRAIIPLLKTKWLCKKDNKRVLLSMEPNPDKTGVMFGVQKDVPQVGGNTAQRREHDKRIGSGTMSRSGVSCPCCNGAIMTTEEIRVEGLGGRLGTVMTSVVVDGRDGKEYRLPATDEVRLVAEAETELQSAFSDVPFGVPDEPLPTKEALGFRVPLYGLDRWGKLFNPRQLLALGTLVKHTRMARQVISAHGYPPEWLEAICAFLALSIDRVANRGSCQCIWNMPAEKIEQTFARFALPILWDFAESNPIATASGNYQGEIEWVSLVSAHVAQTKADKDATVLCRSATSALDSQWDLVATDPPYYDAIPYSDLMDFFYVWLRRSLHGLSPEMDAAFAEALGPKWDQRIGDGELIDDSSRFAGDRTASKAAYEEGMFRSFKSCHKALAADGRMVIVFAHKQPDAWESLVSAMIRAGFVVDGSWPIQTERSGRMRATGSAALASSVWLVCKKRPEIARPGWDNTVLTEMLERIQTRLREFWDAGIRGPDFVWAATGPALEIYSKHPVVKKANAASEFMSVSEFLGHVRRIVVDFIVGQVLSHNGAAESVSGLDDITTYYILHRYDFGFNDAPIGACILYAVSCGLTDRELTDRYELLLRTGGSDSDDEPDEGGSIDDEADESSATSGSKVRLKAWSQRHRKNLGEEVDGKPAPLIDQIHRLVHLWKAGDVVKVDDYLDFRALRRNSIFIQLLQALIELSQAGSEERSILESLSNHVAARGVAYEDKQLLLS